MSDRNVQSPYDEQSLKLTTKFLVSWAPDRCVEIRALGCHRRNDPRKFRSTWAGCFDSPVEFLRSAADLSGRAEGVYFTVNPLIRDVICRANNRIEPSARTTATDEDVLLRRWLLVDCDPIRPAGISSTDDEHDLALHQARAVRDHLIEQGAQRLVLADSGNGGHVLLGLDDVPKTPEVNLKAKKALLNLSNRFSNDKVKIDLAVWNAARITKLYGTLACKGDNCPHRGRPHRVSRILEVYVGGERVWGGVK